MAASAQRSDFAAKLESSVRFLLTDHWSLSLSSPTEYCCRELNEQNILCPSMNDRLIRVVGLIGGDSSPENAEHAWTEVIILQASLEQEYCG